jgi:GNAT superfamily N-acetyltransferase
VTVVSKASGDTPVGTVGLDVKDYSDAFLDLKPWMVSLFVPEEYRGLGVRFLLSPLFWTAFLCLFLLHTLRPIIRTLSLCPCIAHTSGIAQSLISNVISVAKQLNYPSLYLWTVDKMSMYERYGWKAIAKHNYLGMNTTVMKLDLN